MPAERVILALAGSLILLSVVLSYFTSPYWCLLTAFVGLNLFQSAFTGFCPAIKVLKRVGLVRT